MSLAAPVFHAAEVVQRSATVHPAPRFGPPPRAPGVPLALADGAAAWDAAQPAGPARRSAPWRSEGDGDPGRSRHGRSVFRGRR